MTHVTCRLTAKNRDQLQNPMYVYMYYDSHYCALYKYSYLLVLTQHNATSSHNLGACSLIDGMDGRTDGHPTVTETLLLILRE